MTLGKITKWNCLHEATAADLWDESVENSVPCTVIPSTRRVVAPMNISLLQNVLSSALKSGVGAAPLPNEIRKDSVLATHWLATNVLVDKQVWASVTQALNHGGLFEGKDWVWVQVPDGYGYQLFTGAVSYWLIARAFHTSVDSALAELQRFVEQQPRRFWRVIGLAGVDVEGRVEIAPGIHLCHPNSAPASPHLEQWTQNPPRKNQGHTAGFMCVTAVLMMEETAPVRISANMPTSEELAKSASTGERVKLHQIAQCLPLFGPNAATPFANWTQMEEPSTLPAFDWLPRGVSSMGEMRTTVHFPFVDDPQRVNIIAAHNAQASKDPDSLSLALSRFSQAMRRKKIEDAAIELRIALEVLLVRDKGDDEPKAHLIRQRGALALATTPDERKVISKELGEAYAASSSVVHTGGFKRANQSEHVRTGLRRCAELLKRFIRKAPPKDWNDIVFSAQSHW